MKMKQIVSPSNRLISNIDATRNHLQRPRIAQEMTRHVDARGRHSMSRVIIDFKPFESDSVVNTMSDPSSHARDIGIQAELRGNAYASIHKQDVKSYMFDPPPWHWWAVDREQHASAYGAGVVSASALCGSREPDRDAFGAQDVVAGELDGAFDDAAGGCCGGAVVFHADGAALVFLA